MDEGVEREGGEGKSIRRWACEELSSAVQFLPQEVSQGKEKVRARGGGEE